MKKLLCLFFAVAIILAGCGSMVDSIPTTESASSSEETSAELPTENTEEIVTQETTEVEPQPLEITYEAAFNFVKKCEDNIIESNKYDFNKYNESAAEKIIYSAEYATLYCSYWKALEILDDGNDSRFEKAKMRWQIDYSSENGRIFLSTLWKQVAQEVSKMSMLDFIPKKSFQKLNIVGKMELIEFYPI